MPLEVRALSNLYMKMELPIYVKTEPYVHNSIENAPYISITSSEQSGETEAKKTI